MGEFGKTVELAPGSSLGCGNPGGSWVGCIGGALSKSEYEQGLEAAGFDDVSVTFTQEVADGLHGAIVKATLRR